jgi:hypothetical protein
MSYHNKLPAALRNKIWEAGNLLLGWYKRKQWDKSPKKGNPPHQIKQYHIASMQKKTGARVFVETGTFRGDMIQAQYRNFNNLISIEISPTLYEAAVKRFKRKSKVLIVQGDSAYVLADIVKTIKDTAIFWLDGHYSGGRTGRGKKDCPVYEELAAIFNNSKTRHVIIIDDVRLFNGTSDYPLLQDFLNWWNVNHPDYDVEIIDDLMIFSPSKI